MIERLQEYLVPILRWSEKYTKTDMLYLARAGLWGNLNFVIVSVLGLLLSIAFANLLPRETFGIYQYLLSLSSLLTAISLVGMNTAVAQSVARGFEGDLQASVRTQLRWSMIPTLIGLASAGYYYIQGNGTLAVGLFLIALLSPATNVFNTYGAFLNGKRDFRRIFLYGTSINLTYYASIFLCVFLWQDAAALIFANLAANAFATLFFYLRTVEKYKPSDRTDERTISYGKHLSIMSAFGTAVTQLDSVLVFQFLGPIELAIYSFASMLPERVGGLFKFVTIAAMPKFSTQTRHEIQQAIVSKTARAALAGVILAGIYALLAPILFHILFPKYLDAIFFTQIYALIIITMAAKMPITALYALRLQRELYVFNIINPIILLALQVVLLLLFGIIGILMARIISDTINIVLALLLIFFPLSKDETETATQPIPGE